MMQTVSGEVATLGAVLSNSQFSNDGHKDYPIYQYHRPALTVDIVVFRFIDSAVHVLLIERSGEPYAGYWALPGGYVDIQHGETCKRAAYRELFEETGLSVSANTELELVGVYDNPKRHPANRVVSVAYKAHVSGEAVAGDDAKQVRWFNVSHILDDNLALAFDHFEIIKDAYQLVKDSVRSL